MQQSSATPKNIFVLVSLTFSTQNRARSIRDIACGYYMRMRIDPPAVPFSVIPRNAPQTCLLLSSHRDFDVASSFSFKS